ncbi:hypothetical protein D3C84_898140 [compost metagenome]
MQAGCAGETGDVKGRARMPAWISLLRHCQLVLEAFQEHVLGDGQVPQQEDIDVDYAIRRWQPPRQAVLDVLDLHQEGQRVQAHHERAFRGRLFSWPG